MTLGWRQVNWRTAMLTTPRRQRWPSASICARRHWWTRTLRGAAASWRPAATTTTNARPSGLRFHPVRNHFRHVNNVYSVQREKSKKWKTNQPNMQKKKQNYEKKKNKKWFEFTACVDSVSSFRILTSFKLMKFPPENYHCSMNHVNRANREKEKKSNKNRYDEFNTPRMLIKSIHGTFNQKKI